MPRPRHPLEGFVYTFIEEHPGAGPETLHRLMEQQARQNLARQPAELVDKAVKRLPPPSTIGRIKRRFVTEKSAAERAEYRYVRWPESFEAGLLPWEASRVVLDLLRAFAGAAPGPTVRLARWAWHVHLAAPGLPFTNLFMVRDPAGEGRLEDRGGVFDMAVELTEAEVLGIERRDIEWWLAFAPWRGERERDDYERATRGAFPFDQREPIRRYEPGRGVVPRVLTLDQAVEAMLSTGIHDNESAQRAARHLMYLQEEVLEADREMRGEDAADEGADDAKA